MKHFISFSSSAVTNGNALAQRELMQAELGVAERI